MNRDRSDALTPEIKNRVSDTGISTDSDRNAVGVPIILKNTAQDVSRKIETVPEAIDLQNIDLDFTK